MDLLGRAVAAAIDLQYISRATAGKALHISGLDYFWNCDWADLSELV